MTLELQKEMMRIINTSTKTGVRDAAIYSLWELELSSHRLHESTECKSWRQDSRLFPKTYCTYKKRWFWFDFHAFIFKWTQVCRLGDMLKCLLKHSVHLLFNFKCIQYLYTQYTCLLKILQWQQSYSDLYEYIHCCSFSFSAFLTELCKEEGCKEYCRIMCLL